MTTVVHVLEAENDYASILKVFASRELAEAYAHRELLPEAWETYFENEEHIPDTYDETIRRLNEDTDWDKVYLVQITSQEIITEDKPHEI